MKNNFGRDSKFENFDNVKFNTTVKVKSEDGFDLEEKLSELLKNHITLKHTSRSNEKKTLAELTEHLIRLEFENSQLERKNETLKMEILRKDQIISDLKIDLNENKIKFNMSQNKLKMIENTFSGIKYLNRDREISQNKYTESNSKKDFRNVEKSLEISSEDNSSIIEELNVEGEEIYSKKKENKMNQKDFGENKIKNLKIENKSLLNDLSFAKKEIHDLRCEMEEKEKIIEILYEEIKSVKHNEHFASKEIQDSNFISQENFLSIIQNNFEYFSLIRRELIEYLKYYGINEIKQEIESFCEEENFSDVRVANYDKIINNIQSRIESKMDDIKYMLSNMSKINIIFKYLMVDFSKNLWRLVEKSFSHQISIKLKNLSNRFHKINSVVNKLIN